MQFEVTVSFTTHKQHFIQHIISYIFNHKLHTGIFLDSLKIVIVKPLYKKGDNYNKLQAYFVINFFMRYLRKLRTVN